MNGPQNNRDEFQLVPFRQELDESSFWNAIGWVYVCLAAAICLVIIGAHNHQGGGRPIKSTALMVASAFLGLAAAGILALPLFEYVAKVIHRRKALKLKAAFKEEGDTVSFIRQERKRLELSPSAVETVELCADHKRSYKVPKAGFGFRLKSLDHLEHNVRSKLQKTYNNRGVHI